MLVEYTPQQSRIYQAFCHGATLCSTECESCHRIYFVTNEGYGDYEEGELEKLIKAAQEFPDKYINVSEYDSVPTMCHPISKKQMVVGCYCDPTKGLSELIEENAESIAEYLRLFWEAKIAIAEDTLEKAEEQLIKLA